MLRPAVAVCLLLAVFCVQRSACMYRRCSYESDRGQLDKFHGTRTSSRRYYQAIPCRYTMASFHCGRVQAELTLDHGLSPNMVFRVGHTSGGLYIRNFTLNITTTNNDGTRTSQVVQMDTDTYAKYRKQNFTLSPLEWTYSGHQKPQKRDRVKVSLGNKSVWFGHSNVSVTYRHPGHKLYISCYDDVFTAEGEPYTTMCGVHGQTERALMAELATITKLNTTKNDYRLREILDAYKDIVKQTAVQTDPLCIEARNLVRGECTDLGIAMMKCQYVYGTYVSSSLGRCLRKNGIDSFKVYLVCVRTLCGVGMEEQGNTCRLLRKVWRLCSDSYTGNLSLTNFISQAGCPDIVATNATPPPPSFS